MYYITFFDEQTDCALVTSSSSAVCSYRQAASTNHCVTAQQKAATTTGVDAGFSQEVPANICSTLSAPA